MKHVVLGVSGSVAAYRAADLARELMRNGCEVRVCLTEAAEKFVSKALFEALTGQPALSGVFEEPIPGRMAHIDWARWADLVFIAPATANTLNKLAAGFGEDMLTTLVLATTSPVLVAPAMNPQMYADPSVTQSLQQLRSRGFDVIEPVEGDVACGENGQGKLASISALAMAAQEVLSTSKLLEGKQVLITSGPTQEAIDDVRFLTNKSSGKMGSALVKAALRMGAEVTVVAGPQKEPIAGLAKVHRVTSALQMAEAVRELAPLADIIIGAAAVADYRPAHPIQGKMRRSDQTLMLELTPNPDIIAMAAKVAKPGALLVGFAAEPTAETETAAHKLERKGLHAIAMNDVSGIGRGFDAETNELMLISRDGSVQRSGLHSKFEVARWLLTKLATVTV